MTAQDAFDHDKGKSAIFSLLFIQVVCVIWFDS